MFNVYKRCGHPMIAFCTPTQGILDEDEEFQELEVGMIYRGHVYTENMEHTARHLRVPERCRHNVTTPLLSDIPAQREGHCQPSCIFLPVLSRTSSLLEKMVYLFHSRFVHLTVGLPLTDIFWFLCGQLADTCSYTTIKG